MIKRMDAASGTEEMSGGVGVELIGGECVASLQ
jgi:hypothetical protein